MKSLTEFINESKKVTDIYGNDLAPYFKKEYGEKGEEVHKIAQLLSDTFYKNKKQYHKSDTSYLEVEKTWNRGMGRGLLLVVKPKTDEIWVNDSMATSKDYELLDSMLSDNTLNYKVVKKDYDLWSRKWSDK